MLMMTSRRPLQLLPAGMRRLRASIVVSAVVATLLLLLQLLVLAPTSSCWAAPAAATPATPSVISTPVPASKPVVLTPHAPTQPRTLVLLDDLHAKTTHSHLFDSLALAHHQLSFALATDDAVRLERFGTYQYDNIVIMAPRTLQFGEHLSPKQIVAFVDAGYNVLFIFDQSVSEPVRLLAFELGAEIDEESVVVDHFQYDTLHDAAYGGEHSVIAGVAAVANSTVIAGAVSRSRPVLFRGIAHTLPLLSVQFAELYHPVLVASPTAFASSVGSSASGSASGSGSSNLFAPLVLVSSYQTRSNARITFAGSTQLFADAFIDVPVALSGAATTATTTVLSGNRAFVESVSSWALGDRGVLRARALQHKQVNGEDVNPHSYRVSDEVVFSIVLEEFNGRSRTWVPFIADDVQLEFIMFDPAVRQYLPVTSARTGEYSLAFTVPDVYGVYKFVIDYQRRGYTHLLVSEQVSITPYRHNQYERFLLPAYPYYACALSLMAAFYLFGILFLYQSESSSDVAGVATATSSSSLSSSSRK